MLRRPGMIVALAVLALGCIIGSVGIIIPPGKGYFFDFGRGDIGVNSYSFNFYWHNQSALSMPQILIGSMLILPAGVYIVKQLLRARKRTAPGFPMDEK